MGVDRAAREVGWAASAGSVGDGQVPATTRLRALLPELRGAQRTVGEWVLSKPDAAASTSASASRIARQLLVSDSSVVRLAQRLGYSGFPELKLALTAELARRGIAALGDMRSEDTLESLKARLHQAHLISIDDTFDVGRAEDVERAAQILLKARTVALLGAGNSLPICLALHYRLLRIGFACSYNEDPTLQAVAVASRDHGRAVIAVSHSGKTGSVLAAAELAKEAGSPLISIVSNIESPLAELSDVVLRSVAPVAEFDEEALASRVAQLALVDLLYVGLVFALGPKAVARLSDTARGYQR